MPALPDVSAGIGAALRRASAEGALPAVGGLGDSVEGLLKKPVGLFYDLDAWEANLLECKVAFGQGVFHALALKSNALPPMLRRARELGFGAECASIGEVVHARRLGFSASDVIFDSPVKTSSEIRYALEHGIHINIDNFQELAVVAEIRATLPESTSDIGLRVNPLVGAGQIAALSVSVSDSKFGVPIDRRDDILAAFKTHSWLNCVHVHVGSGGMGVQVLVAGVRRIVELALELNASLGQQQVCVLDMGGGMPVNYSSEAWHSEKVPSFQQYAEALRAEVPILLSGSQGPFRRVITEFGQSLNAKAGWLASRIEYTKPIPGDLGQIVIIHFGADVCVRQCYTTEHKRRLEFYDGVSLAPKQTSAKHPLVKLHVAGPLCFQGDHLTKDAEAPRMSRGDVVVLRDAGANTLSLFSRHCLRQVPAAYGYRTRCGTGGVEVVEWCLLKPSEDMEGCSLHWGLQLDGSASVVDGAGSAV